jgi:ADP-heptose:LPS heptosyltransferase
MKKILIINRLGIGDVVLTTPLAQMIKERYSAQVGFVVSPKAIDILKDHPYIDDLFGYRCPSKQGMLEQIRNLHYDEALIVDERFSSTLLALQAGCRLLNKGFEISIGKRRFFSGKQHAEKAVLDYTSYIKYVNPMEEIQYIRPTVGNVDRVSEEKIDKWLDENDFYNKKLVLVVAKGLSENKNWLPEYFAELNEYLNKQDITPVYLGSKSDTEYIEKISGRKINAAGYFSLREVAVVAKQTTLCISLCTGAMHIVSTAGIPIVALYGPTSPKRWAPIQAHVLQADLSCIPCERLYCTHAIYKQCMRLITPQCVIESIENKGWLK